MNHEEAFVHSFIVKEKRSRYLLKLSSQKHRRDYLSRLHGGHHDYDSQFAEQLPGAYTSTMILQRLYELGAPNMCHIIGHGDLDATAVPLEEASRAIHSSGDGVLLSGIPARLACDKAGTSKRSCIVHRWKDGA